MPTCTHFWRPLTGPEVPGPRIDIPAGTIDLAVSPDVIEHRKKSWRVPEHTGLKKGTLLERYRRLVGPATRGATFE